MMTKTVLPFKIKKTNDKLTSNSGLILYAELIEALKLKKVINRAFPKPGSATGYRASIYLQPLLLFFIAGGKYIEDIRKLKLDGVIRSLGRLKLIPSADGIGKWLKHHCLEKVTAHIKVHRYLTQRYLKRVLRKDHTLDIDAFSIFSNKHGAKMTYKGEKGFMPIVGHLAELDWCLACQFREGNVSPNTRNFEFIKTCLSQLPKGHKITRFRSDGAAYQADIFNFLDKKKIKFTITGAKNSDMMRELSLIPEDAWRSLKDRDGFFRGRYVAETYAKMDHTDYFRVVVQRWENPHLDLFEDTEPFCYQVICTNFSLKEKTSEEIIYWHNNRGASELYHKEMKQGFNLDYLPCDHTGANAIWFATALLAYNLHIFAKDYLFPHSFRQKTIRSIRWEIIQLPGKLTRHARDSILGLAGISDDIFHLFTQARAQSSRLIRDG